MSRLGTYVTNFVKTAIYTIQPNKVEEYPYEQYEAEYSTCESVFELHHSFFFYKIANHYDMVYIPHTTLVDTSPKERKVFSLFRFQGEVEDGIATFKNLAEVVHEIVKICDIYKVKVDKVWLEKVTSMFRLHPKWNLAHISASLDFDEAFQNDQVIKWVNEPDKDTGETPLHVALRAKAVKVVKAILALPQTQLDICDADGNTVLHVAVEVNSPDLLEILLDIEPSSSNDIAPSANQGSDICQPKGFKNSNRIDINAMNGNGETCLYLAVRGGSEILVETLLQAGANPKVGNTDCLPIHLAVEKNLPRCVDLLCSYYPDVVNYQTREKKLSTLHIAKKRKMFDHLLELGADPNLQDFEGRTVLHLAVNEQDLDTVMQLLIHAADANMTDNRGISPLHLAAARCQDVHVVYALIVFEADVNAADGEGLTPRHWLCQHESNIYQRNAIRDSILYALDVVQAQRCPPGRANCTAGCISTQAISRRSQQVDEGSQQQQDSLFRSRSSSISYLAQLLKDMPFASFRSNSDPTFEIFNGTPPVPALTNTNLMQDIDNDLFLLLSAGQPGSTTSNSSTLPQGHSTAKQTVKDMTAAEAPSMKEKPEEPPKIQLLPGDILTGQDESTVPDNEEGQSLLPWSRRTVVARLLSSALPGLDNLFVDDGGKKSESSESEAEAASPLPLESTDHNEADEDTYDANVDPKPVPSGFGAESSRPETKNPQEYQQNQRPEESGHHCEVQGGSISVGHQHHWSRSIQGCSARPGVTCCLERYSRCLSARHGGTNASLPSATLSILCSPPTMTTDTSASEYLQRDAEGFRASRGGYRVLCLDGGGIRGLVLCQILRAIERAAGRPIRDLYDWVIGTSTGAMLALNIAQGKCVRYNRCLYFRFKEKVFLGNRPYPTEGLESLLRDEFGESSVMSDLTDIRVSVTALRSDHFPPRLHMFRNYSAPFERMERLLSELLESRTPHTAANDNISATAAPQKGSSTPMNKSSTSAKENSTSTNPITTEVPCKLMLTRFLRELFGETLHEVGHGGEDEWNLQESIVSLLSSFSRRYMYGSRGGEQSVPNSEQLIWHAARASGAAPSYFRACGPFLDGGLIANNPTLDLLTEAQELNIVRRLKRETTIPIASVTSLGTGRMPLREVQQLDVFRPQNVSEAYQVALGVTELSRLLVEMATMSEGRIVERSRAWCSSLGVPFFRFSPLLSELVTLDTKDTRAILQMLWETESYLCNCRDRIQHLVDSLLHGSEAESKANANC